MTELLNLVIGFSASVTPFTSCHYNYWYNSIVILIGNPAQARRLSAVRLLYRYVLLSPTLFILVIQTITFIDLHLSPCRDTLFFRDDL